MTKGTHDNETNPWQSLSLATERLLKTNEKQKKERRAENSGDGANHETDPDQRDRIAEGVRNIERFERRYRSSR